MFHLERRPAMEKKQLIIHAKESGKKAPVNASPDPTPEGFNVWKEDLINHFKYRLDRFFEDNHQPPHDEIHDDVVEAMKDGFKELVHKQPFVENPFHPKEPPPRSQSIRLIDEAFDELKIENRRRIELIMKAMISGSKAQLVTSHDMSLKEFEDWKQHVVNHFLKRLESFFENNHTMPQEEFHDEIVEAMKDGFKESIHGQPLDEESFPSKIQMHRRQTNRFIDEAFGELKMESRRRYLRRN